MQLALADLMCETCLGYVHPFFDRCPGCGTRRQSHYADVLGGADVGAASMPGDPAVIAAAAESIRRATVLRALHGALLRGSSQPEPAIAGVVDAAGMIDFVGGRTTYRARGVSGQPQASTDARIRVVADALILSAARDGRTLASVPVARILGACPGGGTTRGAQPWDGTWMDGARVSTISVVPPGDLVIFHATDRGASSFSISNPSGFFANRPARSHYEELARWIGLLAITQTAMRWREIGVAGYAAELGLVAAARPGPDRPPAADAGRRDSGTTPAAREEPTAREAMLQLEELRVAGLITEAEYEEKRRAILQRL